MLKYLFWSTGNICRSPWRYPQVWLKLWLVAWQPPPPPHVKITSCTFGTTSHFCGYILKTAPPLLLNPRVSVELWDSERSRSDRFVSLVQHFRLRRLWVWSHRSSSTQTRFVNVVFVFNSDDSFHKLCKYPRVSRAEKTSHQHRRGRLQLETNIIIIMTSCQCLCHSSNRFYPFFCLLST